MSGLGDPLEKGQLPTPVFWLEEFHGLYSPWGHKESDMTGFHIHACFKNIKMILLLNICCSTLVKLWLKLAKYKYLKCTYPLTQ